MIAKITAFRHALTFVLLSWLTTLSFCEPTKKFVCENEWDGKTEKKWVFECGGKELAVRLNPSRCSFSLGNELLGWSEILPSLPERPFSASVVRDDFCWSLFAGRRLIAFAFADLPPTVKSIGTKTLEATPTISETTSAPMGWGRVELEDGSVAYRPKGDAIKGAFPLMAKLPPMTDFSVSLETQLNGAKSVGIGFCWGEDGGYLWRWVRLGKETFWELDITTPSNSGWDLTKIYEEPANVPLTSWRCLQVWRSLDQIFVGVDGAVLAQLRENRFGFGQIVVWVETGDLPMPLVKPLFITRWHCASLRHDIDTSTPFPTLRGRWVSKSDSWLLSAQEKDAVALLGEPEIPAWWIVDVEWREEPLGLVFGWVDEKHYNLFRLKPEKPLQPSLPKSAVLELIAVRKGKEKVLDRWTLLLERSGLYRLALRVGEDSVSGFINGLGLVSAKVVAKGKIGLWTSSSLTLKEFCLHTGETPLVDLAHEKSGLVQPVSEISFVAHESVSVNLPAGLPPGVPLSARLSKEGVTLFVERRGSKLVFRLEKQNRIFGITETRMPQKLPISIRLERIDRLILVRLGDRPIWTVKLE